MKPGIRIVSESVGTGREAKRGDEVVVTHSCYLNKGDPIYENRRSGFVVGDRGQLIAGVRYGMEGMKVGGQRRFRASPHLCYGEPGVTDRIPANAVLVFDVRLDAIVA